MTPTHDFGALLREVIRLDIGAPSLHDRLVAALRAAEEQEKRLRELDQRMIEAAQLLAGPPIFRDFTGTDKKTCGYCHTPLEGFSGKHASDCSWVKALALLASPTLENENMNDSNEHTTDMADLLQPASTASVVGALEACIRDLEAQLDSLRKERDRLWEDKARLDAIQAGDWDIQAPSYDPNEGWGIRKPYQKFALGAHAVEEYARMIFGSTLRAALDSARCE